MDKGTDSTKRRTYRRASIYGRAVAVKLKPEVLADVERTADRQGLSLAELLRQCVEAGLPLVRERLRKRSQRAQQAAAKASDKLHG